MPDCARALSGDFSADRIRNTSAKQGFLGRWNLAECHDLPPRSSWRRIYLNCAFYFKGSGLRPREVFNTVKSRRQQYGDREHCRGISPTPVSRLYHVAEYRHRQDSHGHTLAETPGLVVAMRQDGEQTETERQTNKQPPTVLRHNV